MSRGKSTARLLSIRKNSRNRAADSLSRANKKTGDKSGLQKKVSQGLLNDYAQVPFVNLVATGNQDVAAEKL